MEAENTGKKLKERLERFLSRVDSKGFGALVNNLELSGEFVELYSALFSKTIPCSTCPGEISQALAKFREYYRNFDNQQKYKAMKQNNQPKRYQANRETIIYNNETGSHLNTATASDEEIISALAGNPNLAAKFKKPDDWEKDVENYKKQKKNAKGEKGKAEADKDLDKVLPTVMGATQQSPETVEDFLKAQNKKGLNIIAKKVRLTDYMDKSPEEVLEELLALHEKQMAEAAAKQAEEEAAEAARLAEADNANK